MKKVITILLSALMVFTALTTISAQRVVSGWEVHGSGGTITEYQNQIIISDQIIGGATNNSFSEEITNENQEYSIIIDLSEDYEHGDLFQTSLTFGNDANDYVNEFSVMTQRDGDNFVLKTGLDSGKTIMIDQPGLYEYVWSVVKDDSGIDVEFSVVDENGQKLSDNFNLQNLDILKTATKVRSMNIYGRGTDFNSYQLDRDLVLYTDFPAKPEVVINGLDENEYQVGDVVEFTVETKNKPAQDIFVVGTSDVKGEAEVAIEYYEVNGENAGKWLPLESNQFGPAEGFAFNETSSKFRVTFNKAGDLNFTIKIVNVDGNEEVCSTRKSLTVVSKESSGGSTSPDHNWVYRPSYNDSKDEEVKEYTTEDKTKACIELLGKGWEYSESNKSCVYTLDSNTQQIPNTSTK